MQLNKSDLPYLFEDPSDWVTLPNGIQQRFVWSYSMVEAAVVETLDEDNAFVVMEQVARRQEYRLDDYLIVASAIDSWRYRHQVDISYAEHMLGYRGYWEGEIYQADTPILQPEVGVLLGLTHNIQQVAPYIETVAADTLRDLLAQAQQAAADDDAIAFVTPLPIEAPQDAPGSITDAMRRTRAQASILTTRGRAKMLTLVMAATGIVIRNGGWIITDEEIARREELNLR